MSHDARIVAQFTKMAEAFSSSPPIVDREALDLLLEETSASGSDLSLDVACGAGVVACHFASVVRSATGIDITPAMIEKARALQAKAGLANVQWDVGDVKHLPYADNSFSIVTSRYAFHHIPEPGRVLQEMVRVCRAGGVIAVADICVSEDPRKAERFNELEKLNDPTHFRALPLSEHLALFHRAGMSEPKVARYKLDFTLSRMQKALGYSVEAARATEEKVRASIHEDMLGTDSRFEGDETIFSYPIAVLTSRNQVAA
jgi:ubiquinone/menaquinone biosynthesis C-methylase UbiE